jgi:hypothetical protein
MNCMARFRSMASSFIFCSEAERHWPRTLLLPETDLAFRVAYTPNELESGATESTGKCAIGIGVSQLIDRGLIQPSGPQLGKKLVWQIGEWFGHAATR